MLNPAFGLRAVRIALALSLLGTVAACGRVDVSLEETAKTTDVLGTIAFVSGGDLWIRTLPDGNPRRLTTDGLSRQPQWSASGTWLAFFRGATDLWVIGRDGSGAKRIGAAVQARWSPSSDQLAFVSGMTQSRTGLSLADPATGLVEPLVPAGDGVGGTGVLSLAWSPDGEKIAYSLEERSGDPMAVPPVRRTAIRVISVIDRSENEVVTGGSPATEGYFVAAWAGDGSEILFWRDTAFSASLLADGPPLATVDADGSEIRNVASAVPLFRDALAVLDGSPDVAFVSGLGKESWTNKVLTVYSADSGEVRSLTSDVAVSSPRWAGDGRELLFAAMPDAGGVSPEKIHDMLMRRHIFAIDPNSTQPQADQITTDARYRDESPRWIGSDTVLLARVSSDDRASLWTINRSTGDAAQVAEELTPAPGPEGWTGYFGHVDWGEVFDWTPHAGDDD